MKKILSVFLFTILAVSVTHAEGFVYTSGTGGPYKPTFTFSNNISFNAKGEDVVQLQNLLIAQGYLKAKATGYFGKLTFAAVKAFQKDHKLPVTGFVGKLTRGIFAQVTTTPPTTSGSGSTTATTGGITPAPQSNVPVSTASCVPQQYNGAGGGNSSFLANKVGVTNLNQQVNSVLYTGNSGIKVLHFQLNGPWNSCALLKSITVRHLGTGSVSDISKVYITDGQSNILTPLQSFYGSLSTTLILNTPYVLASHSYNNDFYVVINTATGNTAGTHKLAIYPDNDGSSDFSFVSYGAIIPGTENIISSEFTINP